MGHPQSPLLFVLSPQPSPRIVFPPVTPPQWRAQQPPRQRKSLDSFFCSWPGSARPYLSGSRAQRRGNHRHGGSGRESVRCPLPPRDIANAATTAPAIRRVRTPPDILSLFVHQERPRNGPGTLPFATRPTLPAAATAAVPAQRISPTAARRHPAFRRPSSANSARTGKAGPGSSIGNATLAEAGRINRQNSGGRTKGRMRAASAARRTGPEDCANQVRRWASRWGLTSERISSIWSSRALSAGMYW